MLFLVTQKPKAKYDHCMRSAYDVVEAATAKEAIKRALESGTYIWKDKDCLKPEAFEIKAGIGGFL